MGRLLRLDADCLAAVCGFLPFAFLLRVAASCHSLRRFLANTASFLWHTADLSQRDHGFADGFRNTFRRRPEDGYPFDLSDDGVTGLPPHALQHVRVLNLNGSFLLTDVSLFHVAKHCPQLDELHLNFARSITDRGLLAVAHACPLLRVLCIDECARVTDAGVCAVAAHGRLTVLNVNEVTRLTDAALRAVAGCADMRRLHMHKLRRITDDGVVAVARACPQLEEVNANSCTQLTGESLRALVASRAPLDALHLTRCQRMDHGALAAACGGFPLLEKLSLNWLPAVCDPVLDALARAATGLTKLCLNRCAAGAAPLARVLSASPGMRQLSVANCGAWVGDEFLADAARACPRLEYVQLANARVTTAGLRGALLSLRGSLRIVHLGGVRSMCDDVLTRLAECPHLSEVYVYRSAAVTDAGVRSLCGTARALRVLNLAQCPQLTDASLAAVAEGCPEMQKVSIDGCSGMSPTCLFALRPPLPHLETFACGAMNISPDAAAALVDTHQSLASLDVEFRSRYDEGFDPELGGVLRRAVPFVGALHRHARLRALRLALPESDVADEEAADLLRGLPSLTYLTLRHQALSGAFVEWCVRHAVHLTALDLSGCADVDPDAVERRLGELGHAATLRLTKNF